MFTLAGFVFLFIGIYMLAGGERSFSRQWKDLKARLAPAEPAPVQPVIMEHTISEDVEKTGDDSNVKEP